MNKNNSFREKFVKIDELFEKKFTFDLSNLVKLNNLDDYFTQPLWEFKAGSSFRDDLDATRALLDDKDLISWNKHTNRTDMSSFVMQEIRDKIPSVNKDLFTRAWCKFTEIVMSYPILDFKNEHDIVSFNGVFLCEAPGSFVSAASHYIQSKHPGLQFNWIASSLNPYYEQVDSIKTAIGDDRLIKCTNLYQNWYFGTDNQGDLLDINFLIEIFEKNKSVDLVTGDGGINCIDEPEKQEERSFPLIFHQFLAAINCLKPGGCTVIKLFTLFSSQTLSLTYLMSNLFTEISLFKPVTSKSGNSEVYAVCLKLLEGKHELIHQLTQRYIKLEDKSFNLSLLGVNSIPQMFLEQFTQCSRFFKDLQKSAINRNLAIYDLGDYSRRKTIYDSLTKDKWRIARTFLKKYPISPIPDSLLLTFGNDMSFKKISSNFHLFILYQAVCSQECFEKRKQDGKMSFDSILFASSASYDNIECEKILKKWWTIEPVDLSKISLIFGHPFNEITNSRFVDKHLLHLYNLAINYNEPICCERSPTFIHFSSQKTERRFECLINDSLVNCKIFEYIYGPETSPIVSFIMKKFHNWKLKRIVKEQMEDTNSLEGRSFIIIDPYCKHIKKTLIDKETTDHSFVSLVVPEFDIFSDILSELIESIEFLKSSDVLILHTSSCLSRLMVGLICLLTSVFNNLSIIPSFNTETMAVSTNLGMVLLFTNLSSEDSRFNPEIVKKISSTLVTVKNAYQAIGTNQNFKFLLEIFSIPEILLNQSFCELLFTGNFVHLAEKIESILTRFIE